MKTAHSLASLARTGVDFGFQHPEVEDSEPLVNSLAHFLKREPTQPEKAAALRGMLTGQRAAWKGLPNPNDRHHAKAHVKATHQRHGSELVDLRARHKDELASLRKQHSKSLASLRKRHTTELRRRLARRTP